jgi:DNA polymerase I
MSPFQRAIYTSIVKDKIYLVDVSNFIFRSYFALPPMSNAKGEATHALYGFIRSIQKLIADFGATHVAAVFDGPGGKETRATIYEEYKAHRKPTPDDLPHQIDWALDYCELAGIPVINVPGVEADDAIGTIAHKMAAKGFHVYLCSSDKDLAQLVNKDISMLQTHKENRVVGPKEVEEIFGVRPDQIIDLLAIMGDASDNIPGLPGFGPKTAAKLLQEFGSLENILANIDKVAGKKKQETLREEENLAILSQGLATLNLKVPVPGSPKAYELLEPDSEKLIAFFRDKNFTTLLRDVTKEAPKSVKKKGAETVSYTLVDDMEALKQLVTLLKRHKEIAFDTETTDTRPLEAELVGIGFSVKEGEAFYVPLNGKLGDQEVFDALGPLFEDKTHHFIAHNIKYDVHVLANYGTRVANIAFDTMIASYVLNSHSRRHSLDHLALHLFDKVKKPIKDLIGTGKKQISMADVPIQQVSDYCCEDVDYTLRLKNYFEPLLKTRRLGEVFSKIEMPIVPVLVKMERNGIYVDTKRLERLSVTFNRQLEKLEEEIYKLAGEEFKINSPKQLSEVLYKKLKIQPPRRRQTTEYNTGAEVLELLSHEHKIVGKVLEFRGFDKLRSTYVDTLPKEVNPETGRIHCTFSQSVAATGRLACRDPNLQNIPVRTEEGRKIREAFKPEEEGWVYLSADYSQIELRLLAHLSEDPELVKAFKSGDDIHVYTAAKIFNIPQSKVSKDDRFAAKAVNFGIIYGQSAFGLAGQLGIPQREARAFIEAYFERFSRVAEYLEECKAVAKKSGRATTMTGRERDIPEINGRNAIQRTAAERLAVNTPLQGSSADITKLAMLAVDKHLSREKMKTRMLLQIHDELIFEVPPGEQSTAKSLVKSEMEGVMKLKVPLIVDVSVGKNWKEC